MVGETHGQDDVHNVHHAQNEIRDSGLVVAVRREDQSSGDNVMREHLPVVLSPGLDIDDQDLL